MKKIAGLILLSLFGNQEPQSLDFATLDLSPLLGSGGAAGALRFHAAARNQLAQSLVTRFREEHSIGEGVTGADRRRPRDGLGAPGPEWDLLDEPDVEAELPERGRPPEARPRVPCVAGLRGRRAGDDDGDHVSLIAETIPFSLYARNVSPYS